VTTATAHHIQLVDPTGADPGPNPLTLADRPADIRGKRLVLLDNSKANSNIILRAIGEILNDEFEFSEVIYFKKHSSSLPPKPEIMEELHRHADLIVTGIGD
jgi:hypothetical protein